MTPNQWRRGAQAVVSWSSGGFSAASVAFCQKSLHGPTTTRWRMEFKARRLCVRVEWQQTPHHNDWVITHIETQSPTTPPPPLPPKRPLFWQFKARNCELDQISKAESSRKMWWFCGDRWADDDINSSAYIMYIMYMWIHLFYQHNIYIYILTSTSPTTKQ